jgi:hypothetical protein
LAKVLQVSTDVLLGVVAMDDDSEREPTGVAMVGA